MLVVIKFRIGGSLSFLSHAETLRLFQRAFVRAGLPLTHTRGFNPHPKISLPLPRSVGIQTRDDLLCLHVETSPSCFDAESFKNALAQELPPGCDLVSVSPAPPGTSFQPAMAAYAFQLKPECLSPDLKDTIDGLMQTQALNVRRRLDAKGNIRNVNVRPFLHSIELHGNEVVVTCKVTPSGSIRPDEIFGLLGLRTADLAGPVCRKCVQWRQTAKDWISADLSAEG
jgi:radical SAM-linked protein